MQPLIYLYLAVLDLFEWEDNTMIISGRIFMILGSIEQFILLWSLPGS